MTPEDLTPFDACPACGAGNIVPSEIIEKPYCLNYSRCRSCNLMFMNPMPRQAWYDRFYEGEFWERKAAANKKNELAAQLTKEADRAHAIVEFLAGAPPIAKGTALEIGCAYGLLVRSVAHRLGFEPAGIEPSAGARAFAERHIRILGKSAADLARLDRNQNITLLIMSNVLENIVDPVIVLTTIRERLGCHVVIVTPDPLRSMAVSLYHPFVYSTQAMNALLVRTGFDVLRHARDPRDPQAQMFLAVPGTGRSAVRTARALFPLRRRLGLFATRMGKRSKTKRKLRSDAWDRDTIATLLAP